MEDKKGNEVNNLARSLLLGKGHGQFDLLPQVIDSRFLNQEKPIVLLKMIYNLLQVAPDDFNPNSFRNWLARYRKNADNPEVAESNKGENALHQTNAPPLSTRFSLTDPTTLVREQQSLLRRPQKP